jgi:hypothetical protein
MVEVGPEDLEMAFQGFVPAAFWGVQKPSGEWGVGGACWADAQGRWCDAARPAGAGRVALAGAMWRALAA